MEGVDPLAITEYAALVAGVVMTLNAVFLVGFSRHRLRAYNIYIVFSIAALSFRLYVEQSTGNTLEYLLAILWVNLAVGAIIGLAGMMRLAERDPNVWSHRRGGADGTENKGD